MRHDRLQRLNARRTDALFKRVEGITEAYKRLAEDDAVKYALGAMQPIDEDYTNNTYAEGERIKAQLERGLKGDSITAEYQYQGSVTNNTHIRAHSDIDLLAIRTEFFSLEPPQQPDVPFEGDPIEELSTLRRTAVAILRREFPAVTVDDSGGKCIALSGGSLRRKIDVVIGNWWNTLDYARTNDQTFRGVRILDAHAAERISNKPFLHNRRIDERDATMRGNVRRVARLLKSIKYDAEPEVKMSSYDIVSLAYRMPDELLATPENGEIQLVANVEMFLRRLIDDPPLRATLQVPNEMRAIFGDQGASEAALRSLHMEAAGLLRDIEHGLARSFKRLREARIIL